MTKQYDVKMKAEVYLENDDEIPENRRRINPNRVNQQFHCNTILAENKLHLKHSNKFPFIQGKVVGLLTDILVESAYVRSCI